MSIPAALYLLDPTGAPLPERVWMGDGAAPQSAAIVVSAGNSNALYRSASAGIPTLFTGSYRAATTLLKQLKKRVPAPKKRHAAENDSSTGLYSPAASAELYRYRQHRELHARILGSLLIPIDAAGNIELAGAPQAADAITAAWGEPNAPAVASLQSVLGALGAHQWQIRGVEVGALQEKIFPRYAVFAPTRQEYVDVAAQAPLTTVQRAFDIGTGTGVLAALLAKRGVPEVVATDNSLRAVTCATENIRRLGLRSQVTILEQDFFPDGMADLIVCNPPWLPGAVRTPLDAAIYDPQSAMLTGVLSGAATRLNPGGELWLIISDLAELLGMRKEGELESLIKQSGLHIEGKLSVVPVHGRANEARAQSSFELDPFPLVTAARAQEQTSLWRLRLTQSNQLASQFSRPRRSFAGKFSDRSQSGYPDY